MKQCVLLPRSSYHLRHFWFVTPFAKSTSIYLFWEQLFFRFIINPRDIVAVVNCYQRSHHIDNDILKYKDTTFICKILIKSDLFLIKVYIVIAFTLIVILK